MARRPANQPFYPIFVDLNGASVLVIGGGSVAARKVGSLLSAGATVTVIAPKVDAEIDAHREVFGKKLRILRRVFRSSDIKKQKLVFAATDSKPLNTRIAAAARGVGILINVAAPPEAGDIQIPSLVRRGALCIAVSTGGASAALAAAWRQKLEKIIGPEWTEWVGELEKFRTKILREVRSDDARRELLQELGQLQWARAVKTRGLAKVRRDVEALIRSTIRGRPVRK